MSDYQVNKNSAIMSVACEIQLTDSKSNAVSSRDALVNVLKSEIDVDFVIKLQILNATSAGVICM